MAITYKDVRQLMRWIRPGMFTMGSPHTELERNINEEQHQVTLREGFWLAETACTQELWQAVMGNNPSYFEGDKRPVEYVSWDDCRAFMDKWNNEITAGGLCFPTEAQWEYACRAGTTTAFSFGETITPNQVNYNGEGTVEVKSLPCNNWGLYEMHGNVYEWCSDWHDEYSNLKTIDPVGTNGSFRVMRGGCWGYSSRRVRSAHRLGVHPGNRLILVGFRFCLRPQK